MAELINIMEELLKTAGLKKHKQCINIGDNYYTVFVPGIDEIQQFLVVQQLFWRDGITAHELLSKQEELYEKLSEYINKPEFGKNVSLMICIENQEADINSDIEKFILQMEEDIDYFKKLVFIYNNKGIDSIYGQYKESMLNIEEFINTRLKSYPEIDKVLGNIEQRLLLHLLIKLPQIRLPIIDYTPPSIEKELKSLIETDELKECQEKAKNCSDEDIDKLIYTDDTINQLLDQWDYRKDVHE